MKRFSKLIFIFALLLSGLGLAAAAYPAGATAAPLTHANTVTTVRGPNVTCTGNRNYHSGSVYFTYCGGSTSHTNGCRVQAGYLAGPLYAANGCPTQLWLYLADSPGGEIDLCVNPYSSTGALHRDYNSYQVSNKTGRCGT